MRVRGSIAEAALIGERDRREKFAVAVDLVTSKPVPSPAARVRHPEIQPLRESFTGTIHGDIRIRILARAEC